MLRSAFETIVPCQLSKELLVIRCSALGSFAPLPTPPRLFQSLFKYFPPPAFIQGIYRALSHDVTAAILVFQNNETAAILVFQTNPVGVGLFSYVKNLFCSHKFA